MTDSERLDWLELHPDIHIEMDFKGIWSVRWVIQAGGDRFESEGGSLREAIDAAIAAERDTSSCGEET